jgi:RHS repeat-associated protein
METDAFGAPLAAGRPPARFTGKPYDEDMGAYIFPFRNYRPDSASWMTPDPSGFPDGVNNHVYAPNPALEVDGLGLYKLSMVIAANPFSDNAQHSLQAQMTGDVSNVTTTLSNMQAQNPNINYFNDGQMLEMASAAITDIDQIPDILNNYPDADSIQITIGAHGHGNLNRNTHQYGPQITSQQIIIGGVWNTYDNWISSISSELAGFSIANVDVLACGRLPRADEPGWSTWDYTRERDRYGHYYKDYGFYSMNFDTALLQRAQSFLGEE